MNVRETAKPLDWAVAARALPGQGVSGDLHLVKPFAGGILMALVDGIGHGPEARRGAETAVEALSRHSDESVISLVNHCHAALDKERGVVLTVISFSLRDHTITWCGVGNVEAVLYRPGISKAVKERALLRGGIVGSNLPELYASITPVYPGDLIILASDGIRHDFERDLPLKGAPQWIADHIMERHFTGTDDACVLVARYTEDRTDG